VKDLRLQYTKLLESQMGVVVVTHTYNPSYLGGSQFQASPGKKFLKTPSHPIEAGHDGAHLSSRLYIWKANGRIMVQAGLSINSKTLLKNTHRWKGLGTWLKWYCACLASTQP
jgi:hypothetical protein